MTSNTMITGFSRIGEKRELKKALEKFWSNKISLNELEIVAKGLRKKHWFEQKNRGIEMISCNDFSYYDNMLDAVIMLNAIPERFRKIKNMAERYFTMARGNDQAVAMEMTKWFNTNYHYIVPELEDSIEFQLNADKIFNEYQEAKQFGIKPKINIIGPITFIGLSKTFNRKDPYDYFDKVVLVYKDLLFQLSQLDKSIVLQIEEPILVKGLSDTQRSLVNQTYKELALVSDKIRIIVTTYFEHACEAVEELADTGIWGIGLDFVYGKKNLESLKYLENMVLVAGVVDGRNIWISNYEKTIRLLEKIAEIIPKKTLLFQPVVRYFMCHIH